MTSRKAKNRTRGDSSDYPTARNDVDLDAFRASFQRTSLGLGSNTRRGGHIGPWETDGDISPTGDGIE